MSEKECTNYRDWKRMEFFVTKETNHGVVINETEYDLDIDGSYYDEKNDIIKIFIHKKEIIEREKQLLK
jgi:hypothetical protein